MPRPLPPGFALLPDDARTVRYVGLTSYPVTRIATFDVHSATRAALIAAGTALASEMWDGVYTVSVWSEHRDVMVTPTREGCDGVTDPGEMRRAIMDLRVAMGCEPSTSPHWLTFWESGDIEAK